LTGLLLLQLLMELMPRLTKIFQQGRPGLAIIRELNIQSIIVMIQKDLFYLFLKLFTHVFQGAGFKPEQTQVFLMDQVYK